MNHSGHGMMTSGDPMSTTVEPMQHGSTTDAGAGHHDHDMSGHGDHSQHGTASSTGGHGVAHSGMAMTFHFGYSEYVLFDGWHVTSAGAMVASCLGLFLLAVLYEGLKYKREDMLRKNASTSQLDQIRVTGENGVTEVATVAPPDYCDGDATTAGPSSSTVQDDTFNTSSGLVQRSLEGGGRCNRQRMWSLPHFLQTFMHGLQVLLGYMLMLAFMTYNVWLGLAIVLGAMVGYFIFGSKKFVVVDVTEHCH